MSYLFLLGIFSSIKNYGVNPSDYKDLSDEERKYMEYVDNCLFKENEKVINACSLMMFLILKIQSKLGTNEEMTSEDVQKEKEKIYCNLNDEEIEKVEAFGYACIQTMGIFSEEEKNERKLRKERK